MAGAAASSATTACHRAAAMPCDPIACALRFISASMALMKRSAQAIGSQGMAAARWHAVVALEAAAPAIRADERARVRAELGNDHYVIFTGDRWTVEHSVECKLSGHMHECDYHAAVARIATWHEPDRDGRWRVD